MGRPLNKKYFGEPAVKDGNQLEVSADLGSGTQNNLWIVRQKGTRLYDITDGSTVLRCRLVESISGPGEATITVTPQSGPTETTYTLQAHRVKTWQGNDVTWHFDAATAENVNVPGQ